MRCSSEHHAPGCNGECASQPRPLTAGEQARIDRYMDAHHPRVYPRPERRAATLHAVTSTNLSEDSGCDQTMCCECGSCEKARDAATKLAKHRVRQPWEVAA